eukprot:1484275-Prymnesium_polylepis.1
MQSGGISFAACAAGSVAAHRRLYQLAVTRRSPPVTLGYSRRAARFVASRELPPDGPPDRPSA